MNYKKLNRLMDLAEEYFPDDDDSYDEEDDRDCPCGVDYMCKTIWIS